MNILKRYIFFIITDDKTVLQEIQQNIFINKPRILCKKLHFQNAKISDNERTANTCVSNSTYNLI